MKIRISRNYAHIEEFIGSIPEIFDTSGELLERRRNTIKTFDADGVTLNVKSFRIPTLANRVIYKYFRKSKAARSFVYAGRLIDRGIGTPAPVACIEEGGVLFGRSYYVSVHERVDGLMNDIYTLPAEERSELLAAFVRFTAEVHRRGVCHKDYSPGNILYRKTADGYSFMLVDLNRMGFRKLSLSECCKGFSRYRVDDATLGSIAAMYAAETGCDEGKCLRLILRYNRRFWRPRDKRDRRRK